MSFTGPAPCDELDQQFGEWQICCTVRITCRHLQPRPIHGLGLSQGFKGVPLKSCARARSVPHFAGLRLPCEDAGPG